ncbi:MAG: LysM peptidoglycan-binding domain-containing protein [Prochlorococcus marinus subsp. pastoris]|jgi:LysM repeat protein|uniref:lytic transglycosylase n=1 Tax=uncultured Prochlorococcus sp. TaxID=159733 RepID=UPI000DFA15E2|nr:LysM peptidoglycan-binding domain-containing protein [uncultured Prochlorococcus sp.]RCL48653.1 MAG: LysM peptidoglycan-binding domain-containing protein [Prochlorococcus sp. MED-G72]|tara:strand:- start:1244 stop:2005 length:762 start_codon:yes stop_codon:yes gene_type:complete
MKLTFILFALIINFFNPNFIKAEEIIDSSKNQIEKTTKVKSTNNEISDFKKIHIVQVGDTITSISNFYSIKKDFIIKLNNLEDENYIYVGQNLKISDPSQGSKLNKDIKNSYHLVQKGESLTEISTKYGLNFKELIEINNLKNPDSLEVGSKLFLREKNIQNQKITNSIEEENINTFLSKKSKNYGPLTIQQTELKEVSSRKILNALNQNNKKVIISIKCATKDLDVRIPGRKWRGWIQAKEEFEKNLINDFC